jgi:hypothetical protein
MLPTKSVTLAAATKSPLRAAEAEAELLLPARQAEVELLLEGAEAEPELQVLAAQAEVMLPVPARAGKAAVRATRAMQARAGDRPRVLRLQVLQLRALQLQVAPVEQAQVAPAEQAQAAPVEQAQAARGQVVRARAESPAIQWQALAAGLA